MEFFFCFRLEIDTQNWTILVLRVYHHVVCFKWIYLYKTDEIFRLIDVCVMFLRNFEDVLLYAHIRFIDKIRYIYS